MLGFVRSLGRGPDRSGSVSGATRGNTGDADAGCSMLAVRTGSEDRNAGSFERAAGACSSGKRADTKLEVNLLSWFVNGDLLSEKPADFCDTNSELLEVFTGSAVGAGMPVVATGASPIFL